MRHPLWWLAPPPSPRCEACHTILRSLTLPYESCSLATPQAVGQQPVLTLEPHMNVMLYGALLCPRTAGERWCRKAPKGEKPPEVANSSECRPCLWIKPLQPGFTRGKTSRTRFARWKTIQPPFGRGKCTPSAYGTSPGGGGLLYASLSANLSCSIYSAARTSPSGVAKELDL